MMLLAYLPSWLYFVASLRLLSVGIGYMKPSQFADRLFPLARREVSGLMGRTFGVWTLVTCTLCVLTARDPDPDSSIYLATFLSFVYANGFFLMEWLCFQTMSAKNIVSPGIVATLSIILMGTEWL